MFAVIALLAGGQPPTALGQATWNGSVNGNWGTTANWSGTSAANLVNSGTSALVFAGSTQVSTTNTLSKFMASGITFDSTAGNFTLSGSSIRLSGNLANNAANSFQTVDLDLGINITASLRQFSAVATATNSYLGNITGVGSPSYRTTSGSTAVPSCSPARTPIPARPPLRRAACSSTATRPVPSARSRCRPPPCSAVPVRSADRPPSRARSRRGPTQARSAC